MENIDNLIKIIIEKSNNYFFENSIKDLTKQISEINLKINRITNKFDYLIELLEYMGEDKEEDEDQQNEF